MTGMTTPRARRLGRWAALLLWVVSMPVAWAAEPVAGIAVIAHRAFARQSLSPAELGAIFRRTEVVDTDGQPLVPVNLPGHHPLRVAFSLALFDLEPADMEAYWNERYFHGVAPPHVVASVEAMLRFVAATAGAVGYVPQCAVDERVKVVALLAMPHAADAGPLCAAPPIPKLQTQIAR